LPTRVIAELIGLPPEDADRFKSWSDDIAAAISNPGLAPNRDESWPAASLALRSVAAPACGGGAASLG
jgi:cytochrome P450